MSDKSTTHGSPKSFGVPELTAFYATLSAPEGVDVAALNARLDELFALPRTDADIQAYREGRPPWKQLADEVVPVASFLTQTQAQGRIRFHLNSVAPDAWHTPPGAEPIGLEVTRVLARSKVELAKDLLSKPIGRGFQGIADDRPQKEFNDARDRGRITTTPQPFPD